MTTRMDPPVAGTAAAPDPAAVPVQAAVLGLVSVNGLAGVPVR